MVSRHWQTDRQRGGSETLADRQTDRQRGGSETLADRQANTERYRDRAKRALKRGHKKNIKNA